VSETESRWRQERREHAEWLRAYEAGRLAGLREAAEVAYRICAETRHVTLGDRARAAILALAEGKEG
jgi:hypothetical protein